MKQLSLPKYIKPDSIILLFFCLAVIIAAIQFVRDYLNYRETADCVLVIVCILFSLFLFISVYRFPILSKNLSIFLVSLSLSLVIADFVAGRLLASADPRINNARKEGINFDTRERLEVVRHFREQGENYFPTVPPHIFIPNHLKIEGKEVLPLSGIALTKTVGCNESGYYSTFRSDELGFRNPEGVWRDPSTIDLAFVGDSYTQGDCVNEGYHFVDHLRNSTLHVVNLGAGGNGPLLELASIKEYLNHRKVRYLFWIYYEGNDLKELNQEKKDSILIRYLNPNFNQDLLSISQNINKELIRFVNNRMEIMLKNQPKILINLRMLIYKFREREANTDNPAELDLTLFQQILDIANTIVKQNNGNMVFVYLPSYAEFEPIQNLPRPYATKKQDVLRLVSSLGIDIIDIEKAFQRSVDPLSFFPFRLSGHYNTAGYSVVAEEIRKYLIGKGVIASVAWMKRSLRSAIQVLLADMIACVRRGILKPTFQAGRLIRMS